MNRIPNTNSTINSLNYLNTKYFELFVATLLQDKGFFLNLTFQLTMTLLILDQFICSLPKNITTFHGEKPKFTI